MNYLKFNITILVSCLLWLCPKAGIAQGNTASELSQPTKAPRPVAQYPLDVVHSYDSKRYIISPWDVSGHGYHGNTVNLEDENKKLSDPRQYLNDIKLEYDFFPERGSNTFKSYTGVSVVMKSDAVNSYVNIPDFADNSLFSSIGGFHGFSVSFWLHWKQNQSNANMSIIRTKTFEVWTKGSKMELRHIDRSNQSNFYHVPTDENVFESEGWYFMTISLSRTTTINYSLYTYKYDGKSKGKTLAKTMTRPDVTVAAPSLTQAQIMGASFQGSLYNIRIYDNPIAQAQADRLVTADLQYAKNKNAMSRNRLDNPLAQYPLDGKDFDSYRKNKVDAFGNRPILAIEGTVTSVDNRNLRPNTALSLSPGSTLEYPPLFGDGYFNGYDAFNKKDQKGFTISFWVKVDNIAPTPAPYSLDKPFSKSDIGEDYFTGTDASGNKLFGIARIGNNLGVYRYIDRKGERYPWFLWMYDPMSFNGRKNGWYHIIWSQHQGWSRIYIWNPNSIGQYTNALCGLKGEACACKSIYFELQDLKGVKKWQTKAGKSAMLIDDISLYNYPISEQGAKVLHSMSDRQFEAGKFSTSLSHPLFPGDPDQISHTVQNSSINTYLGVGVGVSVLTTVGIAYVYKKIRAKVRARRLARYRDEVDGADNQTTSFIDEDNSGCN